MAPTTLLTTRQNWSTGSRKNGLPASSPRSGHSESITGSVHWPRPAVIFTALPSRANDTSPTAMPAIAASRPCGTTNGS